MKINFILPEVVFSGGLKAAVDYACYLKDQGHDVCCYYPLSGSYSGWKKYIFPPKAIVQWLSLKGRRGRWIRADLNVRHPFYINNKNVRDADISIATAWMTSYWVMKLNASKGKKVYFIQGYEAEGKRQIRRDALRSYEFKMDAIITVSSALKQRICDSANVTAPCYVVNNGMPDREIRRETRTFDPIKKVTIGFPYRRDAIKNCGLLIKVLATIQKETDVNIMAYGFARPTGWKSGWAFYENADREELIKFYRDTDIFVVPSHYEGWGMPAMEAMAQGCAVVAADCGIIREIGIDRKNCVMIRDTFCIGEFESRIKELIRDRELTWKIGEEARRSIGNQLSLRETNHRFETILKNCLKA